MGQRTAAIILYITVPLSITFLAFVTVFSAFTEEASRYEVNMMRQNYETHVQDGDSHGVGRHLLNAFTPENPLSGLYPWWWNLHNKFAQTAASLTQLDLLLMGDSLVEGWRGTTKGTVVHKYAAVPDIWNKLKLDTNASAQAFGITADRVSQLKWRVENGELSPLIQLPVLAFCIGVNDLLRKKRPSSPQQVLSSITSLVKVIQHRHPETTVAVLSLLPTSYPSGSQFPVSAPADLNSLLKSEIEGKGGKVVFLDCYDRFLTANGTMDASKYSQDSFKFLHLSESGYQTWADCLQPEMSKLLSSNDPSHIKHKVEGPTPPPVAAAPSPSPGAAPAPSPSPAPVLSPATQKSSSPPANSTNNTVPPPRSGSGSTQYGVLNSALTPPPSSSGSRSLARMLPHSMVVLGVAITGLLFL